MKKLLYLTFLALSPSVAQEAASTPPAKIDTQKLVNVVHDVVVPNPSEIFAVLDKLGRPNWQEVLRKSNNPIVPIGDSEQQSLLLGTVIAEGFVAVEAEHPEQVKTIGKSVLSLSKAIGVRARVEQRSNAIKEAAEKKDWRQARAELDKAQADVKEAMTSMDSVELSQLVSLGGWVRGTEALTEVVGRDYTKDGAELLHQPVLVESFEKRIAAMPAKRQRHPLVVQASKALAEIKPLMGTGSAEISKKTVGEINAIAAALTKAIQSKSN